MDYGRQPDGKTLEFSYNGRRVTYYNQQSRDWTHPYPWDNDASDLHSAGCGIFSMAFVIEWMSGTRVDVGALADFSCACGGRGDDGTDRPALLQGMKNAGYDKKYGFRYDGDGLVNDHEKLWSLLEQGGCAMCNLRVGHIVAVVESRVSCGERQMLVIDSDCESADRRVREHVREVVPQTMVTNRLYNPSGVEVGLETSFAMYWVPVSVARDFNLIHKRR